ncbi:MAG: iron-sulfur cluster assembly scaffold protein [Candidatus ainarchaeum sp.]|nr:iron-sulfur cluster assembly scaffold protein [Candidatus ainarchaeum sp.]MDD5095941.1 iron-sulfur cluster assembly scaffold protein [Candidatus ainarchaeum sp.]
MSVDYSRIMEIWKNAPNRGEMEDADVVAEGENPVCGDRVRIFLKIRNGRVADASFTGEGCAISIASASLLADYAKGRTMEEMKGLGKEKMMELLGLDLSKNPSRLKCALLPLMAIKKK